MTARLGMLALCLGLLVACGDDAEPDSGSPEPSASPTDRATDTPEPSPTEEPSPTTSSSCRGMAWLRMRLRRSRHYERGVGKLGPCSPSGSAWAAGSRS